MDARLDTPLESWGEFREKSQNSPVNYGRLCYDPTTGIELELLGNPTGHAGFTRPENSSFMTLFGRLVDGTPVTLADCFITKTSLGVGVPTKLLVNRAVFGGNVDDPDQLAVKKYIVELSSLASWAAPTPLRMEMSKTDGIMKGVNASLCRPENIEVIMPDRDFDVRISHGVESSQEICSLGLRWHACVTIEAHDTMPLRDINEVAWHWQNLMTLLVGGQLSLRSATIKGADSSGEGEASHQLQFLFHQRGRHDHPDAHPAEMLLPYELIKDDFASIVSNWYGRSKQAMLAASVFFGSDLLESSPINVKFLAAVQAAESYHRSLGTGVYMNQDEYETTIRAFVSCIPDVIQDDHKESLKNRLKYGNEHSLRKRLAEMLTRVPQEVRLRIAGDVSKFITKVVDTRNYFTHYDHESEANAFVGRDVFVAAERVRVLVAASLLHDLGITDDRLLSALERNREFRHWMSEELPL